MPPPTHTRTTATSNPRRAPCSSTGLCLRVCVRVWRQGISLWDGRDEIERQLGPFDDEITRSFYQDFPGAAPHQPPATTSHHHQPPATTTAPLGLTGLTRLSFPHLCHTLPCSDLRAMFPAVYFEGAAAAKAAERQSDEAAAAIAAAAAEASVPAAQASSKPGSLDDALAQLGQIMRPSTAAARKPAPKAAQKGASESKAGGFGGDEDDVEANDADEDLGLGGGDISASHHYC